KFIAKNITQQITESQLAETIKNSRGRLLPGFIPYSAVRNIIQENQIKWKEPAINCLDGIYKIMKDLVCKAVKDIFSRFPNLVGNVRGKTLDLLEECRKQTAERINFMYQMELNAHKFTLDEQTMIESKAKYLSELHQGVKDNNESPTDTLEVVASVMAYLKIAIKRYVDVISMTIIHKFIDEFSKLVEEKLMESFILSNDKDGSIDELVKEDDGTKYLREKLLSHEKHLREVLEKLVNFDGY
ncbi:1046_t:CDS:2, partial [Scutellospora calospora]